MDKIVYGDKVYSIIETINFSGTKHLIITDNNNVLFVNKRDNKFFPAMQDLSLVSNLDIPLSYIRKQHLLWYLIKYINDREIKDLDSINKLVYSFKKFIKSSSIDRFLYWPLLNDAEFKNELECIYKDLGFILEHTLEDKESKYIDIDLEQIA